MLARDACVHMAVSIFRSDDGFLVMGGEHVQPTRRERRRLGKVCNCRFGNCFFFLWNEVLRILLLLLIFLRLLLLLFILFVPLFFLFLFLIIFFSFFIFFFLFFYIITIIFFFTSELTDSLDQTIDFLSIEGEWLCPAKKTSEK